MTELRKQFQQVCIPVEVKVFQHGGARVYSKQTGKTIGRDQLPCMLQQVYSQPAQGTGIFQEW
jgi:non-ribosomal peptide synthetase component E (peptide arylation enzyme)